MWVDVNTIQMRIKPAMAQLIREPLGLPGNPPPLPPNRARLLRSSSSSEVFERGATPPDFLRLGVSPQGPPPCGDSSPSGSSPAGPQGPLISLKRARARGPSPERLIMSTL